MEWMNKVMNMVAPPATFVTLFLFLPPFLLFKLFLSFLSLFFPENMSGKVVLITGASSAIGEQLAYQYAVRGASLALVAKREDRLHEVADTAREVGAPDVLVVPADVIRADECQRFVEITMNHFGRIDHLVNNAGIASLCMFEEILDITNFAPVMDVNFWGSVYPTYFALPHLKRSRGRIVVIASAAGWLPMPRMSFYNASKAALINFYETLRLEFGQEIGITIVTPGWIDSERFLSKEGEVRAETEIEGVRAGGVGLVLPCALCDKAGSDDLSKRILDAAGAKEYLCPASMQSPPLKSE
ncbi:11-beta-hydroxysteroid dehydrogenase 1A [Acorus calamus]|uniref:11-beta-hydroxysteroid dehydrogenase 1A n=1 Tax=Acorus calamus TaxID=4465 RepID=A0AAV9F085_ACOCL|nr:11-beta-hydroxysteroid dehydrogenase 1A [Acorus calamus]